MHSFYIVLVTKIFTSLKKIAFTRPDIEPSLCEHSTAPLPLQHSHTNPSGVQYSLDKGSSFFEIMEHICIEISATRIRNLHMYMGQ